MKKFVSLCLVISMLFAIISVYADSEEATLALHNFYGDNMVLQAGQAVIISGIAQEGKEVVATLSDGKNKFKASAVTKNKIFEIKFKETFEHGYSPYTLEITDGTETVTLSNIVFGDVYLLAGQSNMEYNMNTYLDSVDDVTKDAILAEMAVAKNPNIRAIRCGNFGSQAAEDEISLAIRWKDVKPDSVTHISAIGYYFAKEIQPYCDYPIGLLDFAWTGSAITPWLKGGNIYNTHIYPIRNLGVKACLWYQGESDENEDTLYFDRQVEFIETLRDTFGDNLPFGYVQLANYSHSGRFQFIRREQLNVFNHYEKLAKQENKQNTVGMISIVDQIPFDFANIHPSGKDEVAARLAAWAKVVIYGESGEYSGPVPVDAKLTGNGVVLSYDHVGSGLVTKDSKQSVGSFILYDKDGNSSETQGVINEDNTVTVRVSINDPVKIAYAYESANYDANLINKENFGATAFAPMDIDTSGYMPLMTSNGAKLRSGYTATMIIDTKDFNPNDVDVVFDEPLSITREDKDKSIVLTISVPEGCIPDYYPVYYSSGEYKGFSFVQVHDGDLGDVNGDGEKNETDVYNILKYLAGYNEKVILNNADVNEDGSVNIADAYQLYNEML